MATISDADVEKIAAFALSLGIQLEPWQLEVMKTWVPREKSILRRPCDCPTEHAEGDWQLEGRDSESEPGDD